VDTTSNLISGDESWETALNTVQECLQVPAQLSGLVRNSWTGIWETREFMRALGFLKINPKCLLRAAEMNAEGPDCDAAQVERAVTMLGVRTSAVVVAINFVCQTVLKSNPPERLWNGIFHEMMNLVEIGYRFGCRADGIGTEGGMLMGFVKTAGLAILMARYPREFADWYAKSRGVDSRQVVRLSFGCESYQVGAMAVQQLGFGPDIAIATALAVGNLKHGMIDIPKHVITWKAACDWIDALRSGQSYPRDPASRSCFDTLLPPPRGKQCPPALELLYSQVAQIRRHQSAWVWHLPLGNYEETAKAMSPQRGKTTRYLTGKGTMQVENQA